MVYFLRITTMKFKKKLIHNDENGYRVEKTLLLEMIAMMQIIIENHNTTIPSNRVRILTHNTAFWREVYVYSYSRTS